MALKLIAAASLALALTAPVPALAQSSLSAYEAARQALLAVWAELPLTVRNIALTTEAARGYGNYTPREGQSYALGEQIHVYVEVLGYGWKDNGDGTKSELLDADLSLVDASGQVVASQAKFLSADISGREKLLETYLTLDATLTSFDPGEYKLRYTLHDLAGGKEATFDVPITLTGPAASSEAPPSSEASSSAAPEPEAASSSSAAPAQ
jgi:hypothetical protein